MLLGWSCTWASFGFLGTPGVLSILSNLSTVGIPVLACIHPLVSRHTLPWVSLAPACCLVSPLLPLAN